MQKPLKLIVVARDQSTSVQEYWSGIRDFLRGRSDVEVVGAAVTEDLELDDLQADLLVVLGGDGAILRACRQLKQQQIPIVGVNLGRLGFLADLSPEEFEQRIDQFVRREYRVVEHLMFECRHIRPDGCVDVNLGLNEVALLAGASMSMLSIHLQINEEDVTTYSCDGLIVSTPVGSTAHSLSAGGPILRQDLRAFVVTPVCAHTLSNRPIVDGADSVYRLRMPKVPEGVQVVIDGQIKRDFSAGDVIEVRQAPVTFKLARLPDVHFYSSLRRKLGWGGQPYYREKRS